MIVHVSLLVWAKHRNVTNRQTNRQTTYSQSVAITTVCIASNADAL